MKKKFLIYIPVSAILLLFLLFLQFGQTPIVNNSMTSSEKHGYELTLTVTANKLWMTDFETISYDIISHTVDNDFPNLLLSYDAMGYPHALHVTVYTNDFTRKWNLPAYSFHYTSEHFEKYNIKDHPEQFRIVFQ